MAGGYGRDLATTVGVHRRTLQEAFAAWQAWRAGQAESAA
jgi:hypothetical protein